MIGAPTADLGWIDGIESDASGRCLRVLRREAPRWVCAQAPLDRLMRGRAYEPSLRPFARHPAGIALFDVPDLSRVHPLIDPGEVAGCLIAPARRTAHEIFVVEHAAGRIYLPAMLLIRELWMWSNQAAATLLVPNSLDLHLGRRNEAVAEFYASTALASHQPSDTTLRRIAWLVQCQDARDSWGSVLTRALRGRIGLTLPRARLRAWAWGRQLDSGLLACELHAAVLDFDLPQAEASILVARTSRACPAPPLRRGGMLSF